MTFVLTTVNTAALIPVNNVHTGAGHGRLCPPSRCLAGSGDLGVTKISANPWLTEMLRKYVRGSHKVGV